jgi:hypothetical protein
MKANSFNSGIASEYLVLASLHRLGLEAYMSPGNKKSIDIRVIRQNGVPVSIDVKSLRGNSSLNANNILPQYNHFIVFVNYNNKYEDPSVQPEIFVVPSDQIVAITEASGTDKKIIKTKLAAYKDKWEYLADGIQQEDATAGNEIEESIEDMVEELENDPKAEAPVDKAQLALW